MPTIKKSKSCSIKNNTMKGGDWTTWSQGEKTVHKGDKPKYSKKEINKSLKVAGPKRTAANDYMRRVELASISPALRRELEFKNNRAKTNKILNSSHVFSHKTRHNHLREHKDRAPPKFKGFSNGLSTERRSQINRNSEHEFDKLSRDEKNMYNGSNNKEKLKDYQEKRFEELQNFNDHNNRKDYTKEKYEPTQFEKNELSRYYRGNNETKINADWDPKNKKWKNNNWDRARDYSPAPQLPIGTTSWVRPNKKIANY